MTTKWFEHRDTCPACASASLRTTYQAPYDAPPLSDYLVSFYAPQGGVEAEYLAGAEYVLQECGSCQLIFQRDVPNDHLMERLYEHWISPVKVFGTEERAEGLQYYTRHAQEVMQLISYFRADPADLDFLDFGMGWGRWALMAKAFGCRSSGTEISPQRIEFARSSGIEVLAWDDIPLRRFDVINTEQVFEHLPHPLSVLCHLRTSLKDDGLLKISVPRAGDIERRLKLMDWSAPKNHPNSLNPVAPLEHLNFFRRSSLVAMAELAEMEEVALPLRLQYRYTTDWGGLKDAARKIALPWYRSVLKLPNYMFLRRMRRSE